MGRYDNTDTWFKVGERQDFTVDAADQIHPPEPQGFLAAIGEWFKALFRK